VQPGWYDDPQVPGQVRWFDGAQWTQHIRPAQQTQSFPAPEAGGGGGWHGPTGGGPGWQTGPPAGPAPKAGTSIGKKIAIGAGVGLAAIVLLGALASGGDGGQTNTALEQPTAVDDNAVDLGAMTCDAAAEEAVTISANSGDLTTKLLKVREPAVVEDNRADLQQPSGTGDVLVMACEGVGVWEDGSNDRVRIEVSLDADQDVFVFYESL